MDSIMRQNQHRINLFKRQRIQSLHSKSIPYRMPLSANVSHSEDEELKDLPIGIDHLYDLKQQNNQMQHHQGIMDVKQLIRLKNKSRGRSTGVCLTPKKQSSSHCNSNTHHQSTDPNQFKSCQSQQLNNQHSKHNSQSPQKQKQLIKLTLYQEHRRQKNIKSNNNVQPFIQQEYQCQHQTKSHCCPFLQIFADDASPQDLTIETAKSQEMCKTHRKDL